MSTHPFPSCPVSPGPLAQPGKILGSRPAALVSRGPRVGGSRPVLAQLDKGWDCEAKGLRTGLAPADTQARRPEQGECGEGNPPEVQLQAMPLPSSHHRVRYWVQPAPPHTLMSPVVGVDLPRSISYGPDSSAWLAGSGSDVISDSGTPRSFLSQVQTLVLISAFFGGIMPGTR